MYLKINPTKVYDDLKLSVVLVRDTIEIKDALFKLKGQKIIRIETLGKYFGYKLLTCHILLKKFSRVGYFGMIYNADSDFNYGNRGNIKYYWTWNLI